CLTLVAPLEPLEQALSAYAPSFNATLRARIAARLGVLPGSAEEGDQLVAATFGFMKATGAAFERTIFDWHGGTARAAFARHSPQAALYTGEAFDRFYASLDRHGPRGWDEQATRYFEGEAPATLLIEEVEALWAPIAAHDDWSAFEAKLAQIERARLANGIVGRSGLERG
ncbi:MAG: protein adenylyltransferase SelO family protein, partial [Alphaproteobacteria bacterium]